MATSKQQKSVSAEAYGIFNLQVYEPKIFEKNEQEKELILDRMQKSFLFKGMDEKNFDIIL